MDITTMSLSDFLQPFPCSCGQIHKTDLEDVDVAEGAIDRLPQLLRKYGCRHPLLLCDETTYDIAGQMVETLLSQQGFAPSTFTIPQAEPVPDEETLGQVLMAYTPGHDMVVAVGSGTMNDMGRFFSHRLGLPYIIVATAPSMDGYASTVAPLITNNLKTTYPAHSPRAIVADLSILSKAPAHMVAAGFGDILGKYTCLCDWRLSALVNGEYYCQQVAEIMALALRRTVEGADALEGGDVRATANLMEALVLAGIAMSYVGNSRPASGCEHHLSHLWEMRYLFEGRKAVLHGTKVGIATLITLRLYKMLLDASLDFAVIEASDVPISPEAWEKEIRRVYGKAAEEVLTLEKRSQKNSPSARAERLKKTKQVIESIRREAAALPTPEEATRLLSMAKGPTAPLAIGLDKETVMDSICYAKELRDRYTLLQLLWDMGLLYPYAQTVADALFPEG